MLLVSLCSCDWLFSQMYLSEDVPLKLCLDVHNFINLIRIALIWDSNFPISTIAK